MSEIKEATEVVTRTLVGVAYDEYPLKSGNCFSVRTTDNCIYDIVNFVYENVQELQKRGLGFPFKIKILCEGKLRGKAIFHDSRIPDAWYQTRYCEVCCPEDLLPLPQQMAHLRQIDRGERKVNGDWTLIDPSKAPKI